MTSQDNARYITVEMFNNGIAEIKAEIHKNTEEIRAEIRTLDKRVEINSVKIDELHYFMGIGFAIMAVVVVFVGFVITLAPMFREMYRDAKKAKSEPPMTRSDIQSMIDEAISRALSAKNQ